MNKEARALVLEMIRLLGKALDTGGAHSRLSPDDIRRLNEVVEKLMVHDSDQLVKGMLHALVGSDLSIGLKEKLQLKY